MNYKYFIGTYLEYETLAKEYDCNDELVFKGKNINGEKIGITREYDYKGKLIFEGEYIKGVRNGKGTEYRVLNNN